MTRADVCVVACAEAWRGDGAVLASGMGPIPLLGARLAQATFEPELLVSDGEALLLQAGGTIEGWMPFRSVFDTLWAGRRHVMMGASQLDRFGNQNIACIGEWKQPKSQLLGVRGAPGNTISHATSYWVPRQSPRVFVERVDFVSGLGWDRGAAEIRRIVTDLAVYDFETADHRMRLRSLHPGVTVEQVIEASGFEIVIDDDVSESRAPSAEEWEALDRLDPDGARHAEVK